MVPKLRVALAVAALWMVGVSPAQAWTAGGAVPPQEAARGGLRLDLPTMEEGQRADASRTGQTETATAEDAEARAAAEAEAARVREANAAQRALADADSQRIAADRQAQAARLAQYREQQRLHDEALTNYADQVAAAEAARRRWQADVAACKAGEHGRCGASASPR